MSLPVEADFALIKLGDGATPTEVFAIACGLQDVNVNRTANSSDRFVRDCAKPGEVPTRKVRVNGKQLDITGSGLIDKTHIDTFEEALGTAKNYKVELYADDGTDAGDLIGTFAGPFVMTAANMAITREGGGTAEVTLANHGPWTWTPAG
ncbi:hypothetical protein Saro_2733 [Novosphingobium aromaticivorans DSM 12444]|uniref:Phage tail tube protein n=1 Tax=Novosphingobium aromaticivorans (strain ATCC 700278 / DSM 12444 / CCUG 56034 / CIP 105152 / NBRC 16084 / F199) TaxID=279238 RepID=Q2G4Q4_NOVAD|nr:hypothetical protein [Novosphingobium aromaticivorans]ABD27169.1 hypothetical protein Saro_2733 [Novosphingobium aromaticivorans DSM 12444]SCY89724.1 hypothetical protein SAMN05660666_03488 [Novosphingobium aromaticivorans]